jgi:hypothetical protein
MRYKRVVLILEYAMGLCTRCTRANAFPGPIYNDFGCGEQAGESDWRGHYVSWCCDDAPHGEHIINGLFYCGVICSRALTLLRDIHKELVYINRVDTNDFRYAVLTTDTQWRHKSKKPKILGWYGRTYTLGIGLDFRPCSEGDFLTGCL